MTPRLSAILPNYNSAIFLPKALDSLVNQTEPLDEIIIVDDGSTDNSLNIINAYMAQHPHIHLVKHEKNQGVCLAINHGIEKATGDYIIMCAADDWYDTHMVAAAKKAIAKTPEAGLICADAMVERFDLQASFRRTLAYKQKNTWITPDEFKQLARQGYVGFNGGGGMFMQRQAVLEAGLMYPELRWHCDWLLYFTIAFKHGINYIDNIFVYINMRKESYSEGKRDWQIQKQVLIDTVDILDKHYPSLWDDFKTGAIFPSYSLRYISLFLLNAKMRRFFSLRLLWKFIINNAMIVRIGRLFPYSVILFTRKLLRA